MVYPHHSYETILTECKNTTFFLSSIFLFIDSPAPDTLKPATTTVEGNLGSLYELVDDDYKSNDYSSKFDFDMKRNDKASIGFDKVGVI